jgi:MFS family permease
VRSSGVRPGEHPANLGLRANLPQFLLLVGVNALVGGMYGQERALMPLLAREEFALRSATGALTFIVAFGLTKPVANLVAGMLSDRFGRKPVLVAGWVAGLPVPLMIIFAPGWEWIVAANVLLGVNQGLAWSATVIMKIDLAGPRRRGLAMGFNEAAGYGAVAFTALITGVIASSHGLRPEPFLIGLSYAGLGLSLSALFVRETRHHAALESETDAENAAPSTRRVFSLTSFREPTLSSCSQAGMVNNLNDGLAWGLFPLFFAEAGLDLVSIGTLAAVYPGVWGVGQLITGGISDRWGRKRFIVAGMLVQAAALIAIGMGDGFGQWVAGLVLLGVGTAMVYPTLLAAIGDVARPSWRASAVGVYRLWRDLGFAIGAILAGVTADAFGIRSAIFVVAALTAASGVLAGVRMYETHPPQRPPGASGPPLRWQPNAGRWRVH